MKIVLICGSREIQKGKHWIIENHIRNINREEVVCLHGGANGVDSYAESCLDFLRFKRAVFYPNYKKYGRFVAPHVRNSQMLKICNEVVAFWDGRSRGTKSVIDKARKLGKPLKIFPISDKAMEIAGNRSGGAWKHYRSQIK